MKLNAFVPVSNIDRSGDVEVRITRTEGFTPQPSAILGRGVDDIVAAVARLAWSHDADGNVLSIDQPA